VTAKNGVDNCRSDFRGAENIFWPVHENRLAIVPPVFRFNVLALAEAAPAAADPDLAGVT